MSYDNEALWRVIFRADAPSVYQRGLPTLTHTPGWLVFTDGLDVAGMYPSADVRAITRIKPSKPLVLDENKQPVPEAYRLASIKTYGDRAYLTGTLEVVMGDGRKVAYTIERHESEWYGMQNYLGNGTVITDEPAD